jgi:hypothetical protein
VLVAGLASPALLPPSGTAGKPKLHVPPARQLQALSTHEQSPVQVTGPERGFEPPQPGAAAIAISNSADGMDTSIVGRVMVSAGTTSGFRS